MSPQTAQDDPSLTITREDHRQGGRFVLSRDGVRVGTLDYRRADSGPIYIDFVEVSPTIRGRGLGRRLVVAAVNWARESQRAIIPICSYSRSVIESDASLRDTLQP